MDIHHLQITYSHPHNMKTSQTTSTTQHNQIIRKTYTLEILSLRKNQNTTILLINKYTKQQRTHSITPNSTSKAAQFLPQPHSNQEAPSHNLDTSHHTTHQQLYQTAMNTFNHTKLNFASSPIPSTTLFKPGGTITMSQPGYITSYYSSRTIPNSNE